MHVLETPIEPAEPYVPASPRRLGRFRVSSADFQQWEQLLPLMSRMVVLATGYIPETSEVEYTAFCEQFEPCRADKKPPLYEHRIEDRPNEKHLFMRKAPHQ